MTKNLNPFARLMLALSACLMIAFPAQAETSTPLTAENKIQLEQNLKRGKLIYDYDQAAWQTTDTLREDIKDPAKAGVRGWVVLPDDTGGHLVTYYGFKDKQPFGIYSARYDGEKVTERKILAGADQQLTQGQIRLINTRNIAIDGEAMMNCSKSPFNTVVLPRESEDAADAVYFMTPQTKTGSYPFGGHHRVEVKDGKITGQRKFTNGCLEIEPTGPEGNETAALVVTHLLDPVPTEIHMFMVYTVRKPVFVIMSDDGTLWELGIKDGEPYATRIGEGGKELKD